MFENRAEEKFEELVLEFDADPKLYLETKRQLSQTDQPEEKKQLLKKFLDECFKEAARRRQENNKY